jgi:hypothetical protein
VNRSSPWVEVKNLSHDSLDFLIVPLAGERQRNKRDTDSRLACHPADAVPLAPQKKVERLSCRVAVRRQKSMCALMIHSCKSSYKMLRVYACNRANDELSAFGRSLREQQFHERDLACGGLLDLEGQFRRRSSVSRCQDVDMVFVVPTARANSSRFLPFKNFLSSMGT